MKCVVCPNLSKKAARKTAAAVCGRLRDMHAEIVMENALAVEFRGTDGVTFLPADQVYRDADFAIAIGGDGTILRCAGQILDTADRCHTPPVRLVGINTGTLGFLAAFEANELDMLSRLSTGEFDTSERMLLQCSFQDGTHGETVFHALNDIYASRINGTISDFAVYVDDVQIGRYRADGIIFSTPTGSTAYALSAGGPVMEPDLSLIEMNLICPHSLFARPTLFSPKRRIRVTYRGAGAGSLSVFVDGAQTSVLHDMQSFTVTQSPRSMLFINCKGTAFYDALNGKLMQPLKGFAE